MSLRHGACLSGVQETATGSTHMQTPRRNMVLAGTPSRMILSSGRNRVLHVDFESNGCRGVYNCTVVLMKHRRFAIPAIADQIYSSSSSRPSSSV